MSERDASGDGGVPAAAWPSEPAMLVDTRRCPGCFAPLTGPGCAMCGLDVADPRAHRVLELSYQASTLWQRRADLIRAMRVDQRHAAGERAERERAARERAAALVATDAPVPAPAREHAPALSSPPPRGDAPPPPIPAPPAPLSSSPARPLPSSPSVPPRPAAVGPARPRRSGVQVFLLSVGVVLLAVAAVFFLTVAWIGGGLVLRSAIIALATAGVVVAASLLRRRRLTVTAEGIAVLGVALVALDAWAVRANDLAGAGAVDGPLYAGAAALGCAALFGVWSRLSRLRAPLTAAVAAAAVAPGLLVSAFVDGSAPLDAYAFALAVVLVALAAPAIGPLARGIGVDGRLERGLLLALAGAAAVVATVAALLLEPANPWAPLWAGLPLALVLALHAALLARRAEPVRASAASTAAVLVPLLAVAVAAVRLADPLFVVTVPLLVPVVVALVAERARARQIAGAARVALGAASTAAAAVAAIAAFPVLVQAVSAFRLPVVAAFAGWQVPPLDVAPVDAPSTAAVVTLAAAVVLAAVGWPAARRPGTRRAAVVAASAVVLVLAGPQLRAPLAVVAGYLVLAAVALAALRRPGAAARLVPRPVALAVLPVAAFLAYVLSFASAAGWTLAAVGILALLVVAAGRHRRIGMPLAVVVVLFAAANAALAPVVLSVAVAVAVVVPGLTGAAAVAVTVAILLVLAVTPVRTLFADEHRPAAALAAVVLALLVLAPPSLVPGEASVLPWMLAAAAVATLAVIAVALSAGPPRAGGAVVRPVAAIAVAPFAAAAVLLSLRLAQAPSLALAAAAAGVALLVVVAGAALTGRLGTPRAVTDAGAVFTVLPAVTLLAEPDGLWLPLLFVAAAAIPAAVSPDGLFASRHPRRQLIWIAPVAGAVALWLRLGADGVTSVEPYTLPPAAVVLLLAVLVEHARRRVPGRAVATPATLAGVGLALALVPSALGAADDVPRAVAVAAASGVLLVAGAWARPPRTPDALPLAVAVAAAVGAATLLAVRLTEAALLRPAPPGLDDALVVVVAAALLGAALGTSRRDVARAPALARGTLVAGTATLALGAAVLAAADGGPLARVVLAVLLLGALAVLSARRPRPPFGWAAAVVALGGAAVVGVVGLAAGARPVEAVSLSLAAGVVGVAGADRSVADDSSRRRPLLWAVGLAVGLVPSAVLAIDDRGAVRAIAVLGVAALLMLVAALRVPPSARSLTAPTVVLAGIVLAVVALLRGSRMLGTPEADAWMLGAAVPLLVAGVLLGRRPDRAAAALAPGGAIAGLALVAGLCALELAHAPGSTVRAGVTVAALAAVGVTWRGPAASVIRWTAIGLSAGLALVAATVGRVEPVEAVLAPVAVALLVCGTARLRRDPAARSWVTLGPGLVLLLVPPVLADLGAHNALWRVVSLGVVSLLVLLAGVRGRLQAPVLLGGIVLLVHAIAQLWPGIVTLYEAVAGLWWLWLGVAGAVLIVLAATYERRIREVRAVALALRSLR